MASRRHWWPIGTRSSPRARANRWRRTRPLALHRSGADAGAAGAGITPRNGSGFDIVRVDLSGRMADKSAHDHHQVENFSREQGRQADAISSIVLYGRASLSAIKSLITGHAGSNSLGRKLNFGLRGWPWWLLCSPSPPVNRAS